MFLLDTNAVSESRKLATSNVDPVFKNWIDEIDPNLLYVSVMPCTNAVAAIQAS